MIIFNFNISRILSAPLGIIIACGLNGQSNHFAIVVCRLSKNSTGIKAEVCFKPVDRTQTTPAVLPAVGMQTVGRHPEPFAFIRPEAMKV